MSGKWVVDYKASFDQIQHKEFNTEEEAIKWGKALIANQSTPIHYMHLVYEPEWQDESQVPAPNIELTPSELPTSNDAANVQEEGTNSEIENEEIEEK